MRSLCGVGPTAGLRFVFSLHRLVIPGRVIMDADGVAILTASRAFSGDNVRVRSTHRHGPASALATLPICEPLENRRLHSVAHAVLPSARARLDYLAAASLSHDKTISLPSSAGLSVLVKNVAWSQKHASKTYKGFDVQILNRGGKVLFQHLVYTAHGGAMHADLLSAQAMASQLRSAAVAATTSGRQLIVDATNIHAAVSTAGGPTQFAVPADQPAGGITCTTIASGAFSDPTIWDTGVVPGPNDTAIIALPGGSFLYLTTAANVGSLQIPFQDSGAPISFYLLGFDLTVDHGMLQTDNPCGLFLFGGGSLTIDGAITCQNGLYLELDPSSTDNPPGAPLAVNLLGGVGPTSQAPPSIDASSGGNVTIGSSIQLDTLNLGNGATLTMPSVVSGTRDLLRVEGGMSIDSTSKLNLGNSDLLIDPATGSPSISTVTGWLQTGSDNLKFDGLGLTSSIITAERAAGDMLHTLASLQTTAASTFDGQSIPTGEIIVGYTYFGDANLDGKVDGSDYSKIDYGFLHHLTGWANGDFNYDNVINGSDYTLMDNTFNTQGSPIPAAG